MPLVAMRQLLDEAADGGAFNVYKFTSPPTGEVLAMDLIEEIHRRLPRAAMQDVVAERMRQFGQAGQASDYEARPLAEMQLLYA
jgi:hypothetical protein